MKFIGTNRFIVMIKQKRIFFKSLSLLFTLIFFLFGLWVAKKIMLWEPHEYFQYLSMLIIYSTFLIVMVIIRFILKPQSVSNFYKISNKYLDVNFADNKMQPSNNLFSEFLNLLVHLIILIPIIFSISWFVHFTGLIGAYIFIFINIFTNIWCLRKNKNYILLHLLYIPPTILLLLVGQFQFASVMVGSISFLILIALNYNKIKISYNINLHMTQLKSFINYHRHLSRKIEKKFFSIQTNLSLQATVIFIIILFYLIGPLLINFMPNEVRLIQSDYDKMINETKDYIPYIAFVFYIGLMTSNFLPFLTNPFAFHDKDNIVKKIINFFLSVLIGLFLLPIFIIPMLIFSILLVSIGYNFLGFNFTIFLGFFVFPIWINKFYSNFLAFILWSFPEKNLIKKISEQSNSLKSV